jgi:putative proteasome-type protease
LALIPAGSLAIAQQRKIEADDADLATMMDIWSEAQREALYRLPRFDWEGGTGG